jgi:5'-nucleotidase
MCAEQLKSQEQKPLILVVNDDGVDAKGIRILGEIARQFGRVVMVAPNNGRSGMSHAVTFAVPLRLRKIHSEPEFEIYKTNGTPVDAVKLALHHLLKDQKIDLLLSGINQGSNTSVSVIYSATVAAAIEGCLAGIPSVAFSVPGFNPKCDFEAATHAVEEVIKSVLKNGLPSQVCLTVNIPNIPLAELKGFKITRQAENYWKESLEMRADPVSNPYFWMSGSLYEADKGTDTDQWAVKHNYISVHPIKTDWTDHAMIQKIKKWKLKLKK